MLYQDDKMKKSLIKILIICLAVSILLPTVNAAPSVWSNTPKTDKNSGETFELRFEILADETANYTVTIDPGAKFSAVDGENSMTIEILKDETRTFIFNMQIDEDLEDGKHVIYYDAFKNDEQFKSEGKAYVRAGQQAPGFEILAFIGAIAIALFIWRKKR